MHAYQPFSVRRYWNISFPPLNIPDLHIFLRIIARRRYSWMCDGRFTSALLTFHALGWTAVSWFSQGCDWGHGYVCTSHTGCRTGTHWNQQEQKEALKICTEKENKYNRIHWLKLLSSPPALVGSFRGEFVAAAAVGGVAEWSVWGGRAWPRTYWAVT